VVLLFDNVGCIDLSRVRAFRRDVTFNRKCLIGTMRCLSTSMQRVDEDRVIGGVMAPIKFGDYSRIVQQLKQRICNRWSSKTKSVS
jgi:hypothetical protein